MQAWPKTTCEESLGYPALYFFLGNSPSPHETITHVSHSGAQSVFLVFISLGVFDDCLTCAHFSLCLSHHDLWMSSSSYLLTVHPQSDNFEHPQLSFLLIFIKVYFNDPTKLLDSRIYSIYVLKISWRWNQPHENGGLSKTSRGGDLAM